MYLKIIFLCIFLLKFDLNEASDVLGCGGFIKSHAPIDFSKIEVKLFTKQGSLKDSTFCAPNNGYYFLPLYDKGEYYLRINPPTGWSFMPKEVLLKVDGVNDLCSQSKDINFVFEGFGITGQVDNMGGGLGPKGVKITLTSQNEIRETVTNEDGGFYFTPVYPGTYVVSASHPKWIFKENKHTVQVASENKELPKNSFLVIGYDVSGSVTFERHPISNIEFILFKDSSDQLVLYDKCNKQKHSQYQNDKNYLCYVTSNEYGQFVFPQLSPGSYKLVPFFQKAHMKYHIYPEQVKFQVTRDSLVLAQTFEVQSFSFSGTVLTHPNGQSIQGATVFVNDKPVTTTQPDGSFKLDKVTAGTYSIHIEAPGLKFDKKNVKINPTTELYTEFTPSAYQICGVVTSEQVHTIIINSLTNTDEYKTETMKGGEYCTHLPPGKYTVRVDISKAEQIQFFPVSQTIQVTSAPISDINFSQLKATVKGTVKCFQSKDCEKLNVIMKLKSHDEISKDVSYTTNVKNGQYVFNDVVTGMYVVSLAPSRFIFANDEHEINVNSEITIVPEFTQIGNEVVFISSHDTQVSYKRQTYKKTFRLFRGNNRQAIEGPGLYEFTIESCHLYKNNIIKYNTNDKSSEIVLTALKHTVSVEIMSKEKISTLTVDVIIDGVTNTLGPLTSTFRDNHHYYKVSFHLADREVATLAPHAESVWFEPAALTITGENYCKDFGARITALKGKVIQGKVVPPLAGVKITVEGPGIVELVRETDASGVYKFPTLDDSHEYKVTASKNSYTFTGPDNNGVFKAHKLAEIIVTAVDEKDGSPLQGALISLSGGESYRSNLQTNSEGVINFSSLSPSDYFLRPMMKEYNFEPSSKMISIKEGATIHMKLSGHRVAYSAYGLVTSLSGEPEDKMIVVADGVGDCGQYSEEATTEDNGQFRIRGLHPKCKYEIKVKNSLDPTQRIERAVPDFIPVVTENQDIHDLKLIALRHIQHMDIVVQVLSSKPEYFRSLRLKLCKESNPSSPVYNIRLDPTMYKPTVTNQHGILIHLPPLAVDNKPYFVQLESSLSQAVHNYRTDIEYFLANTSFKYIKMDFNPQSPIQDQDIGHTSVLALPFILLVMIGVYNIQQITKFITEILNKYNLNISNVLVKSKSPSVDRNVDNDEIDQIVQNINAVKRKVRPRKI